MFDNNKKVPVIVLNDIVVFPGCSIHFDLYGKRNIAAVDIAIASGSRVLVLPEQNDEDDGDSVMIGTLADIRQIVKTSSNSIRVMVKGIKRVELKELELEDKAYKAYIEDIVPEAVYGEDAMLVGLKDIFVKYNDECGRMNAKLDKKVKQCNNLDELVDIVAGNASIVYEDKVKVINIISPEERYDFLATKLMEYIRLFRIKMEYRDKVKASIDNNQKEYYLREQLKVIREELGDSDTGSDADLYLEKTEALNASEEVKDKLREEIRRFRTISSNSSESAVIRAYIETLLALPWYNKSEDNNDIINAEKILNKNHYGLDKVKERIIEFLAVRQLAGKGETPIVCLVGPPGTGKTSIAKSVAEALNKEYIRICLGGVRDEAEIRGHRKTYVGAMPGRLINSLKKAKVSNPLILLDEIDKVSNDYKGDTFSALLEVLDPEQNEYFTDHYIEIPVDLSEVLFICTANDTQTIPGPLLDRMEIISISGYTENEKYHIAKEHLIGKQKKKNGIKPSLLNISDTAIRKMIINYTREAGVRGLERTIGSVCRKAARELVAGEKAKISVTAKNIEDYLGKVKYEVDKAAKENQVGIVRGLAWTSVGGDTLEIEVNVMNGKGELKVTGQLGDVMKESAAAALTYVRSLSCEYNVEVNYYQEHDIHIHVPEGAVPKDGPSAGITMATALFSAVMGRAVRHDVAMTGEVTLRGRVLPIGGLKEKLLAAYNAGISTVLVPGRNKKDIEELEEEITAGLDIVYVNNMEEVLSFAMEKQYED